MNVTRLRVLAGALLVIGTGIANAADGPLVATDVKQVDRDYWFQGSISAQRGQHAVDASRVACKSWHSARTTSKRCCIAAVCQAVAGGPA